MLAQEEIVLIKGKRSKRPRPPSPLALTMSISSSTTDDIDGGSGGSGGGVISDISGSSSSCKLTRGRDEEEEEEDMANCLILLAKGQTQSPLSAVVASANTPATAPVAVEVNYPCKTCSRSFSSFQALGGHRASHMKPINKPILAVDGTKPLTDNKRENSPSSSHDESTILSLQIPSRIFRPHQNKKIRVHECSICGAEFSSGQALGGHMRRHRPQPASAAIISSHGESREAKRPRTVLSLDLNLPAPEDNHDHQRENKFSFPVPQEQVVVFSASSLVDCHY